MTDIRDLKPIMEVFPWELLLLGILLLSVTLFALWKVIPPATGVSPNNNRKSRSIRQRLDMLKHKKLSPAQLCESLGELMHDYLRFHYGIPCHRLTTHEILEEIRRREVPESIAEPLLQLFEACDLVKFAKWQPQAVEIDQHLTSAYWVVENTKENPA